MNIDLNNFEELKIALLNAVKNYEAIVDRQNQYGQKYIIDFPLSRDQKTAVVHTVWIVKNCENFPRLVTCYVL